MKRRNMKKMLNVIFIINVIMAFLVWFFRLYYQVAIN